MRGSFRDPSGFVFVQDGEIYRQVNRSYREHYEHLMSSGLHRALLDDGLVVAHREVDADFAPAGDAWAVIQPERVPFVSYPYEWCFGQLRDAALATLRIQEKALAFGMTLKDCSAYNIQFLRGRPVLIDTLSFEIYRPGRIWVPYEQFCRHFLAPLALMSRSDVRLAQLLRIHVAGVPLDLAAGLLPWRSRFSPGLLTHVHAHALSQRRRARGTSPTREGRMSRLALEGLVDSLKTTTEHLSWRRRDAGWTKYYDTAPYSAAALEDKRRIVGEFLRIARPRTAWDLGANTGLFTRIASALGIQTIAFDADPSCVENLYARCKRDGETGVLPLVLDLANPSPGLGWAHAERMSLLERGPADAVLALALVHHLAISNNVPLPDIASMLARMGAFLVIEFVPKDDAQVQELLAGREDVFPTYTQEHFERCFRDHFAIVAAMRPSGSERTLYLMRREV